jgi:hypothetical protein
MGGLVAQNSSRSLKNLSYLRPGSAAYSLSFVAHSLIEGLSVTVLYGRTLELERMPNHEKERRAHETEEEAAETPTDEPKPAPVEDPPKEPNQPPYVVGRRASTKVRTEP